MIKSKGENPSGTLMWARSVFPVQRETRYHVDSHILEVRKAEACTTRSWHYRWELKPWN